MVLGVFFASVSSLPGTGFAHPDVYLPSFFLSDLWLLVLMYPQVRVESRYTSQTRNLLLIQCNTFNCYMIDFLQYIPSCKLT